MKTLLAFLTLAAGAFAADEAAAPQPQVKLRVTGLFSPDRENDLRKTLGKVPGVQLVSVDFNHAEATFSFDPAVAFPNAKSETFGESLDAKIRAASNGMLGVQPLLATPKEQLARVEIPVFGLDCKACCLAAYESIYKIDGVAQATASFKEGRVTALIDPNKTDRAALEAALVKRQVKLESR